MSNHQNNVLDLLKGVSWVVEEARKGRVEIPAPLTEYLDSQYKKCLDFVKIPVERMSTDLEAAREHLDKLNRDVITAEEKVSRLADQLRNEEARVARLRHSGIQLELFSATIDHDDEDKRFIESISRGKSVAAVFGDDGKCRRTSDGSIVEPAASSEQREKLQQLVDGLASVALGGIPVKVSIPDGQLSQAEEVVADASAEIDEILEKSREQRDRIESHVVGCIERGLKKKDVIRDTAAFFFCAQTSIESIWESMVCRELIEKSGNRWVVAKPAQQKEPVTAEPVTESHDYELTFDQWCEREHIMVAEARKEILRLSQANYSRARITTEIVTNFDFDSTDQIRELFRRMEEDGSLERSGRFDTVHPVAS